MRRKKQGRVLATALVGCLAASSTAAQGPPDRETLARNPPLFMQLARRALKWDEPAEPTKIVGPIYSVGTRGLSVFLVKTTEGLIVIDTPMPGSGPMVEAAIRKLGFDPKDIRLLLAGHAHSDHVGAHAYLQKLSGARVAMINEEKDLLESGGKLDFQYGAYREFDFEPVKVDQVFGDGEVIKLGDVAITGPAALPIHVKSLLDKLGIQADFLHVGAYKGAMEPLTRDAPSKESEETLAAILDRRYRTMVEVIAAERKLPPATVEALIDTGLFPADQARAAGLIDDVGSFEAFRHDATRGAPWTKLELDPDKADRLAMLMKLWRFLGAMPPDKPDGDHVAVVYALGDIVDGGEDGVLGARQHIASHTLVAALRAIAADDSVKAVVLRIDSGGGSAQASELIWRAVAELKAHKPVIVSMSDVAASGGYYIASGATKIFALEDTLTGSIGVVGGKLAPRDALAKLGVHTFPIGRGKRATMMASLGPWTADERTAIQRSMEAVYQVFVGRVAEGRRKKPEEIQAIAQGRVWTGSKARELGLVDEIGGLDAALAEARTLAKVDAKVDLEIYPPSPTLHDVLSGFGQVHAPFGVTSQTALAALDVLDPAVAAATEHLVKLVLSFRSSTIQAVAMLPVMP